MQLLSQMNLELWIIWLLINFALNLISIGPTIYIMRNLKKPSRQLIIIMSLRTSLWTIWSYISRLRPFICVLRILTELKLRILTNLVIESLIVNIIRIGTRVPIRSLIKGPINRMYNQSLYWNNYYRQQLCPYYNWPSRAFIML